MRGAKTVREAAERVGKEDSVFFSENFLVPRPLMSAITSDVPVLLLIDEVDKGDPEFEAFLLEVLSDFQVTVPEVGTIRAKNRPLVFLTSNNSREMSDALKRRCLHLFINFPNEALELQILEARVPEVGEKLRADLVRMMQALRQLDLKKTPSISETLDWARALLALNAKELDREIVEQTLNVILKYQGDVRKAESDLDKLLAKKSEEQRPDAAAVASPAKGAGKDALRQV
jgi:MoxR-like ATPase